jgi:hypothetical protein
LFTYVKRESALGAFLGWVAEVDAQLFFRPTELILTKLTYKYAGRDFRLTDVKGSVVKEIVA